MFWKISNDLDRFSNRRIVEAVILAMAAIGFLLFSMGDVGTILMTCIYCVPIVVPLGLLIWGVDPMLIRAFLDHRDVIAMNENSYLQSYGLEALLTNQDDPALWEAALRQHWPTPESPDCLVDALRFNIGRRLLEGEQPHGEANELHANMRGMVDVEEWCFERVGTAQLRIKQCPPAPKVAPILYQNMQSFVAMMSGQTPLPPPAQTVFMYLGISRPSRNIGKAVVYAAWSAPGVGDGAAHLWQRQDDGVWEQSDQCVSRWIA